MNEQELCKKRLIDLSKQANRKGIVLFSDFLNLNELDIYHRNESYFETKTETFGGMLCAERQIAAFIPDALCYEWNYPISVLQAVPTAPKFAQKLGHRDILGSLMSLGVDRAKIGDIVVKNDCYFFFCEENIADYFCENLTQIKHTPVRVQHVFSELSQLEQNFLEKDGIAASNRLDSILACVYKLSRSQALSYLKAEKVFVNGKCIQNTTYHCREEDIISVRGFGRFVFVKENGETNKGRIKFHYKLYE